MGDTYWPLIAAGVAGFLLGRFWRVTGSAEFGAGVAATLATILSVL